MIRIILVCFVFISTSGFAPRPIKSEELSAHYKINQADLQLRGAGVKSFLMMKVFTAKFYASADIPPEAILLEGEPKHLEVHFYTHIGARDFTNFTISTIKKNLSAKEVKAVSDRFAKMGEYFPDINSGDTLALTYVPGEGTSFIHNGKVKGIIPGGDFGKAVFSTWIGPKPFDVHLKVQILGCYKKGLK